MVAVRSFLARRNRGIIRELLLNPKVVRDDCWRGKILLHSRGSNLIFGCDLPRDEGKLDSGTLLKVMLVLNDAS